MRILIDANIWVANPLLRTPLGAALLFRMTEAGGVLLFPEVVEHEMRKHLVRLTADAISAIRTQYDTLATVMGMRDDYKVPDETAVRDSIESRLKELSPLIHRLPMTLSHAQRALERVIDGRPPNGKNQQFKDSLIWESALDDAGHGSIDFVSKDTGFYEGRDLQKGLAGALRKELQAAGVSIRLHASLEAVLNALEPQTPGWDEVKFEHALLTALDSSLRDFASSKGFTIEGVSDRRFSAFLTGDVGQLAISFQLIFEATDSQPDAEPSRGDQVHVEGTVRYDQSKTIAYDARLERIDFLRGGVQAVPSKGALFLHMPSITPGRGVVAHAFRNPIPLQSGPSRTAATKADSDRRRTGSTSDSQEGD